ncbi:MAG: hypothetical protein ACNA8W_12220, partial [Bradymonadaceae bacterium]
MPSERRPAAHTVKKVVKAQDISESDEPTNKPRMTRRRFLWLGGVGVVGALAIGRFSCYDAADWNGTILSEWQAHALAAAALTLIPDVPGEWPSSGPSPMEVAHNVDRFLVGMPPEMLTEIGQMFGLIEHGTLLGGRLTRFSNLSPEHRLDFLVGLRNRGGLLAMAFEGLRALCLLGWYQDDRTWKAIGYDGPMIKRPAPPPVPTPEQAGMYGRLVAKPGAVPRGVL